MKKIIITSIALISLTFYSMDANAQAQKYLNFGGLGTGLYAGYEIPVSPVISVQPFAETDWDFNRFILGAKGNFYFDDLFGINESWDVYAGANFGYRLDNSDKNDDGANWGIQVGGRWFWNEKWGINAEFGGGSSVLGGVGVTMKL